MDMSSALELIPLVLPMLSGYTVLDVGCGRGKWGYLIRVQWWCTKDGKVENEPDYLVGVDVYLPFLETVKRHQVYDDVVLCDASRLPFRDHSFDSVLASDILEHLPKEKGRSLLLNIDRVGRRTMVITTPHFVRKRPGHLCPEGYNPYEAHLSKWGIKELRSLGYRVFGAGFLVFSLFSARLNALLSPISYIIPTLSANLVAVKTRRSLKQKIDPYICK